MKKLSLFAAVCGLMMTACVPTNTEKVPGVDDQSKDATENPSKDPGKEEAKDAEPEGEVCAFTKEVYDGHGTWENTSKFTFHYDSKGRLYAYDEHVEHDNGNVYDYTRCYVWVTDTRVEFRNTNPSHQTMTTWFFNEDGTVKRRESPDSDEDNFDTWTMSYTSDGRLDKVDGYFYIYIDDEDITAHRDWLKWIKLYWNEDGNITRTEEEWMPSSGKSIFRDLRKFTYYGGSENPCWDKQVDPIAYAYFVFIDTMWLGHYGPTPKQRLRSVTFEDRDLWEPGDGYFLEYGYSDDGVMREIYVTRRSGGFIAWTYKYHIYYYGIEDKDPVKEVIPEIN